MGAAVADRALAFKMSKEKKLEILHNRPDCIGCGACAAIFPDTWKMNQDGKADVIGSDLDDKGWEHKNFEEKDFELNMECAQSCPVNVIHIKKDDEELI